MTALQRLHLDNNQLTTLPEALGKLMKLERLFLHGNPALGLPAEVLGSKLGEGRNIKNPYANPAAILDYYFRIQGREAALRRGMAGALNHGHGNGHFHTARKRRASSSATTGRCNSSASRRV